AIEILAQAVLEQRDVDDLGRLGGAHALGEVAEGFRRVAPPAEAGGAVPPGRGKRRGVSGVCPRRRKPARVGIRGSSQPETSCCWTSSRSFRFDMIVCDRLSRPNSICCGVCPPG